MNYINYTIHYFYINATSGELVQTINFDDVPINVAAYNPTLDKIVGLTTAGKDDEGYMEFEMVYADPVTLEITRAFTPFGSSFCSWEAVYSQDVDGGVFYGVLLKLSDEARCDTSNGTYWGHLVGVDVNTGTAVSEPEFCEFGAHLSTTSCPWALQYLDDK